MEFWPAGRGDGNLNQMAGLMDMTKPDQLQKFQSIWWNFFFRLLFHKGLQDLSKNGNCDGIQIIICYKCNVKWLRIVQATCWLRNRMDLIKFGNFIFFRNFSLKKNIWVFSKFLVMFYWKKLSCLEMHFAPSWAVWAIKLFFVKYFLEKVFLWKVK